jgi:hypothetical protein
VAYDAAVDEDPDGVGVVQVLRLWIEHGLNAAADALLAKAADNLP